MEPQTNSIAQESPTSPPPAKPATQPRQFQSDDITKFIAAFVKAQAAMETPLKTAENSHFKNKFAPLSEILRVARAPLAENEIAFVQTVVGSKELFVETRLIHSSGQFIGFLYPLAETQRTPQGLGSALTYARRYALQTILGVAGTDEDDDGETAHGRAPAQQQAKAAAKKGAQQKQQASPAAAPPPAQPQGEPLRGGWTAKQWNDYFEKYKWRAEQANTYLDRLRAGKKATDENYETLRTTIKMQPPEDALGIFDATDVPEFE